MRTIFEIVQPLDVYLRRKSGLGVSDAALRCDVKIIGIGVGDAEIAGSQEFLERFQSVILKNALDDEQRQSAQGNSG